MRSAMMSRAPASASSSVSVPFFSSICHSRPACSFAAACTSSVTSCAQIKSASGSSPFSFAVVARVRFFCRNGAYKSSSTFIVSAAPIFFSRSAVSSFRSSSDFMMLSRRLSSSSSCSSRSRMFIIFTSSSSPVRSLRYRAMNGTVPPSSSSTAVAATCRG